MSVEYKEAALNCERRYVALEVIAYKLIKRMEEVHADERYRAVWERAQPWYGPYGGPTYTAELEELREAVGFMEYVEAFANFLNANRLPNGHAPDAPSFHAGWSAAKASIRSQPSREGEK